jgi:hypothetical protein
VQVQLTAISSSGRNRRDVAAIAAVLLLVAQLVGALHVHPWAFSKGVSEGAQLALSESACPVCALHFHSPTNTNPIPSLAQPVSSDTFIAFAMPSRLPCSPKPQLFGRAPPASV